MLRKVLMVAAAAAIPLSAVALDAGAASASKAPPPPSPPLSCTASGTVNFAAPGISHQGSASPNKVSTTTTSGITFGGSNCGTGGSGPANTINSKSAIKCSKKVSGQDSSGNTVPSCVPGDWVYDSFGQFESTGVSTIQKDLKKLTFVVNGITFAAKTTSASQVVGGQCTNGSTTEAGFDLSGTVKAKPFTYSTFSFVACLGVDSGTDTTGNFFSDIAAEPGNNNIVIAGAAVDGVTSSLSIS